MAFVIVLFVAISIIKLNVNYAKDCARVDVLHEDLNRGNAYVMRRFKVKTLHECLHACRAEPECKSFQLRRELENCYLLQVDSISTQSLWNGIFFSNVGKWNVGPCSDHACADDENCHPAGAKYVCKKAYDVCYKHLPEQMCFKRFEGIKADLYAEHNLETTTPVRSAMGCVTFKSLVYEAKSLKCSCKNASMNDLFHTHVNEFSQPSETADIYFKIL